MLIDDNVCKPAQRYAFFLPTLGGGGAERAFVEIANELANRGEAVDLVVGCAQGPNRHNVSTNVQLFDLNAVRVARAIPGLCRYLKRVKPVGLVAAMPHANIAAIIARAFAKVPTKIVISERADPGRQYLGLKGQALRRVVGWFYRSANKVIAVSNSVKNGISKTYGVPRHKIRLIYNPLDLKSITQLAQAAPPHPWLEDSSVPLIVAAGRLADVKGFDTLISAFSLICQETDARLIILGEGPRRDALEALVKEKKLGGRVLLPGYAENPFVYMARARIFVVSSISEGFPNVLIQAMACGTSVISTDCGSAPSEILQDGTWGRIVPVGDAGALAQSLITTLRETNSIDTAVRARDFSVTLIANQYLNVLSKSN